MLDVFRRLTNSKIGVALLGIFVAAIALGFAAADIRGLGITGPAGGDTIAKVGRQRIGYAELREKHFEGRGVLTPEESRGGDWHAIGGEG